MEQHGVENEDAIVGEEGMQWCHTLEVSLAKALAENGRCAQRAAPSVQWGLELIPEM